ncbi:MAG: energy-coupling factor transporter ATPase [Anaerovoracaceae bacterium]
MIKIENAKYKYNDSEQAAIDGVSLEIKEGSFTVIIGRNGSGKSTLAKMINALLIPTEGKVIVNGWDTSKEEFLWDIRQHTGMVFQNPDNQIVSSIVEDDVAFGPENLGIEPVEIRKRVNNALKSVDMLKYIKGAPHLLSGGQKQRIAIAGVVAMKPKCIIFDEPTAMLDPQGRKEVMEIIRQLHSEGITVILITHFMEEAVSADRVIIMNDGKIVIEGSPIEVFKEGKKLREISLELPFAVEMAERLREKGMKINEGVMTIEELSKEVVKEII